jgi:hypothetical protein
LDLLVENKLIVELKSVEALHDIHPAQVLTYHETDELQARADLEFQREMDEAGDQEGDLIRITTVVKKSAHGKQPYFPKDL